VVGAAQYVRVPLIGFVDALIPGFDRIDLVPLSIIASLTLLWLGLTLFIRRMHNTDRTG